MKVLFLSLSTFFGILALYAWFVGKPYGLPVTSETAGWFLRARVLFWSAGILSLLSLALGVFVFRRKAHHV